MQTMGDRKGRPYKQRNKRKRKKHKINEKDTNANHNLIRNR